MTNSQRHFAELDALIAECAVATIGGYDGPLGSSFISFSSESGGPELRQEFAAVERRDVKSQLHVTDVSPVLDYARSMRAFVSDTEYKFVTVLAELERRATAIIARDGALVIRSLNGIFVCR